MSSFDREKSPPPGRWGWRRYLLLARFAVAPGPDGPRPSLRRTATLLAIGVPFAALQLFHRLCLGLDEWLFPGLRRVAIERPLFIVGVPRSGTTFTHRVIAEDRDQFTTCRLWELLFAPAVVEKRFFQAVGAVDRLLGRPLGRLARWVDRAAFRRLEGVHGSSLFSPEEDFLALLPYGCCFLLVLAFPQPGLVWPLGRFDAELSETDRRRLAAWYRGVVARHLYVHGRGRRYLSKNPSFSSWTSTLAEEFPDCRLLANVRAPSATIPSQLSSVEGGLSACGDSATRPAVRDAFVELLEFYYQHLAASLRRLPSDRYALVRFDELTSRPRLVVEAAYQRFGYALDDSFRETLAIEEQKASGYRSTHRYSAEQFGLDDQALRDRFDPLWARYEPNDDIQDSASVALD